MIRNARTRAVPASVGLLGGLVIVGVGGVAVAEETGSDGVEVGVTIQERQAGALSLSVAAGDETLVEVDGASDDYREFTGVLPDVTVTDTRSAAPEGVYWYVTGQASDFVGTTGQDPITPDHLGWAPTLVTEGGNGEVAEGEEVLTSIDESTNPSVPNNVGLAGEELLQLALDSEDARAANGTWTANAALTLKTPNDVEPGSYSSTLTLTLFEDTY